LTKNLTNYTNVALLSGEAHSGFPLFVFRRRVKFVV